MWEQPIRVGKTAATGGPTGPKIRVRRPLPPPPEGYEAPTDFPMFNTGERIVIDIETYDPDLKEKGPGFKRDAYIVGVGVRTKSWGQYYPVRHDQGPNCEQHQVFRWLRDNFEGMPWGTEVTGTNLLYDVEGLATCAKVNFERVRFRPVDWAEPLLDENQYKYGLDAIAFRRLGRHKVKNQLEELYGEDFIERFNEVHPGHAHSYVMGDLDLPFDLLDDQEVQLKKEGLWDLYDIECRNMPFLAYMRDVGVRVNLDAAQKFSDSLKLSFSETQTKVRHLCGFDVNPNAPNDLVKVFDHFGLAYPKTALGNPSFTKGWLANHPHEIADLILDMRKFEKFDGTFVQGYILDSALDGRVFGQFHPLRSDEGGTVSGRFSSSNPNLQNIPIKDDVLGPLIRALFIPEEGQKWWSLDYSQIEYRFLVHYAVLARCVGADKAAAMYRQNAATDFHEMVASLTGVPRKQAKNINFGLVYGMGVWLLASGLGLLDSQGQPLPEAHAILKTYHTNAPFVKAVYDMASNRARDIGFIRTVLQRKRRFNLFEPWGNWKKVSDEGPLGVWEKVNEWQGRDAPRPPALLQQQAIEFYGTTNVKRAYTHKALNAVLQGSAADLMKLAMVQIWESGCVGPGKPLQCHLTVHDELDGSMEDTPAGHEALEEVRNIMIKAIPLKVPVLVSGSVGNNWAEAK